MGIFDRLFGKKKEKARVNKKADVVEGAIARLSNASDEKRVEIAMELLKHPNYEIRAAVASVTGRSGIKAVGVWFELANRLGDDYEKVRLEAAKAFWQLEGVGYAIRSLRDEYENPAHMSKENALRGINTLRETGDDKSAFEKLLEENWEDCPRDAEKLKGKTQKVEEKNKSKIEVSLDLGELETLSLFFSLHEQLQKQFRQASKMLEQKVLEYVGIEVGSKEFKDMIRLQTLVSSDPETAKLIQNAKETYNRVYGIKVAMDFNKDEIKSIADYGGLFGPSVDALRRKFSEVGRRE